MIFRLFSPHGHGQCTAMRYISKHEADVYLDKEEKTQRGLSTEKKRPRLQRFLQMSRFWTALQWRQFPFLHNAVGLYLFSFSRFLIEIRHANVNHHKWTRIRKLTITWNRLPLWKTAGRKYIKHLNLKNNINHYQKHVTLTQIHSLKSIINWIHHKPVCFETLHWHPGWHQRPSRDPAETLHSQWSM